MLCFHVIAALRFASCIFLLDGFDSQPWRLMRKPKNARDGVMHFLFVIFFLYLSEPVTALVLFDFLCLWKSESGVQCVLRDLVGLLVSDSGSVSWR